MNIKEILLSGGDVSFPYKEKEKDWVGTAKIGSIEGVLGLTPGIVLQVPTLEIKGRKEFKFEEIDETVSLFTKLVFNKKNLMYKRYETTIELYNEGYTQLDLEIEEDYKLVKERQKKLQNG